MRRSYMLSSSILLSAILSFSVFPTNVLAAQSFTTNATVNLQQGPIPNDPNMIRDPYDPDLPYPGDINDPGNDGTGSVGPLTLDYVSNLRFGTHELKQGGLTATAKNTHAMVQITDSRANGNGWTLQLRPDSLVGEQTGASLNNGYLYLGTEAIRKPSSNVSAPPVSKTLRIPIGSYENIVVAPQNTGLSTWTIGLNQDSNSPTQLVLNDTANAVADHYVGSLSWSLTNAPS
ncbi:WxL domain-containing protein [Companilactobacillus sp.]|uniref:WxL domain-containing protein n=1 Tax=Companilactobacillus sp. TaxID=2767905 RepID=UPI00262430F1|nr:WxL domain-containing protein [Companilactobacillus sp.]